MKTKGKAWQLVLTVLLIAAFVYTAFFGVAVKYGDVTTTYIKGAKDIRFGVDIKGGVNVTFVPSDGYDATDDQLEAAQLVIENRLVALNVTDYELYVDNNSDSLILEFPWQSGETEFDPEAAIEEIGTTAYLTFREGSSADGELVLDGSMVESAAAQYGPVNGSSSEYYVALKFTDEGAKAFGDATTRLYQTGGTISIWLDDENVSTATVNTAITDGQAIITSSASNPFTQDAVVKMARQINSGALPFALSVDSYSTVSPSLGENSLGAMVLAGLIAFALIVVLMTALYRLPGFLACIALAGQVAATLAFVSGYFPVFESFTLTLPGIAGIILAIGMGVDANVITAERIKEELNNGKSLDGALKSGFARGLTPIIDGNVTIVIVAIVLMGAFGPSDGFFAKALHFVFFAFGPSTAGTIYAFGYTLLTGVLLNFVFGVFATRVMIRGAASIKALRNPWFYGAVKPGKEVKEKKNKKDNGSDTESNKSKTKEIPCMYDEIVCDLLPVNIILDEYFSDEKHHIDILKAKQEEIESLIQEMTEEHEDDFNGYDKVNEIRAAYKAATCKKPIKEEKVFLLTLADMPSNNKNAKLARNSFIAEHQDVFAGWEKFNKADIKRRIGEIENYHPLLTETLAVFKEYLDKYDELTSLKVQIKELTTTLTNKVVEKYASLTEDEIRTLVVERKWLATVIGGCMALMQSVTHRIGTEVASLVERYENTLPELTKEVSEYENEVNGHLAEMGFTL